MTQRIEYQKQSPELFKKFLEFSMAVKHSTIEESIHDLVNIRASQINGCAFCLDMHVKEATIHGERRFVCTIAPCGASPHYLIRESGRRWHGLKS
jgi:AhpD family alkylhydroperoxidase